MELTIEIIISAINGDEDALLSVLKHYDSCINAFSFEEYIDTQGNKCTRFDADIKQLVARKATCSFEEIRH